MSKNETDDLYVTDVKGNVLKKEKDCSEIMEISLKKAREMIKENKLDETLELLLATEKQCRLSVDLKSTTRLMIFIIQTCFYFKDYEKMNSNVILLIKRRGQLKNAVTDFVKECCIIIEQINDINEQICFIETISKETMGKVYVENERARLIRKLANIKEQQGNFKDACTLMQELQIESYLTMPIIERIDFMLDQLRMVYGQGNYSLAEIISQKIDPKHFSENFELTNKYHILMAKLQNEFKNYVSVALHYKALLDSESVKPGTEIWKEAARGVIVILLMAERSDEQVKEIKKLRKIKNIDVVAPYNELLTLFLHNELIDIDWFINKYQKLFIQDLNGLVCHFNLSTDIGRNNWNLFLDRVSEYNVYVISQHYMTIKLVTMAQHLKISVNKVEDYICSLVGRDILFARINNPEGYVSFVELKSDECMVNEWANNLKHLMLDVKLLSDDINKEISLRSDVKKVSDDKSNDISEILKSTHKRLEKLQLTQENNF